MNKKSVFARRLADRRALYISVPLLAQLVHFRLTRFSSRGLAIPFRSPLMDSYIITGASRSRITLDKYHRERKDMKFSGRWKQALNLPEHRGRPSSPDRQLYSPPPAPIPHVWPVRFSVLRFSERDFPFPAPRARRRINNVGLNNIPNTRSYSRSLFIRNVHAGYFAVINIPCFLNFAVVRPAGQWRAILGGVMNTRPRCYRDIRRNYRARTKAAGDKQGSDVRIVVVYIWAWSLKSEARAYSPTRALRTPSHAAERHGYTAISLFGKRYRKITDRPLLLLRNSQSLAGASRAAQCYYHATWVGVLLHSCYIVE